MKACWVLEDFLLTDLQGQDQLQEFVLLLSSGRRCSGLKSSSLSIRDFAGDETMWKPPRSHGGEEKHQRCEVPSLWK
uniref:Uncharacterized protein n=1 Tax=Arundo donax TaxID=35708 RepID=A0A0A9BEK9_ARUDO